MLELVAAIIIASVALTFFSDIMSRAVKLAKPRRAPRGEIQVADAEQSAA